MASNQRSNYATYTHQLEYAVRRDFCNLMDADNSWRDLGGNFMGLDSTQLSLIGLAIHRIRSPTEELLLRLDSANVLVWDLCRWLEETNNWRAVDILKDCVAPEVPAGRRGGSVVSGITNATDDTTNHVQIATYSDMLSTPQHSFADHPRPIMDSGQWMQFNDQPPTNQLNEQQQQHPQPPAPHKCHNQILTQQQQQQQHQSPITPKQSNQARMPLPPTTATQPPTNQPHHDDPQEAIVRKACASNKKRTTISNQEEVNQLRLIMQIKYSELKAASNNFSDKLLIGNGGFASVYRTNWKGTEVAIKRLKCNLMDQALNELTVLNSYRIDNILPIYGISIDGPEACLVYQFMANGSLEDRIGCKGGSQPLSWAQRAQISEGLAKGIHYLHTLKNEPLIHGDVKSANILLDAQFQAKLGDFGLARQVFNQHQPGADFLTSITVTSINGTSVYLPDEYLRDKRLSTAVDVYSYGVVLLEMATGQRPVVGKGLLVKWVEERTSGTALGRIRVARDFKPLPAELRDRRLPTSTESELRIWRDLLLKSGLRCTHRRERRPPIGDMLDNCAELKQMLGLDTNFMEQQSNSPVVAKQQPQLQVPIQQATKPASPRLANTARTLTPDQSSSSRSLETPTNDPPPQQQQASLQVNQQPDRQPKFVYPQQVQPQNYVQQLPNNYQWIDNNQQQEQVTYVVHNEPQQVGYIDEQIQKQPPNGFHQQSSHQHAYQPEYQQQDADLYEHQQQHDLQQQCSPGLYIPQQQQYVIMQQNIDQNNQVFQYHQQDQIYQLDHQQQQQQQQQYVETGFEPIQQANYQPEPHNQQHQLNKNPSSALNLMSVEEIPQQNQDGLNDRQEVQSGQAEVEAMIPLLTELGVSPPENQQ